MLSVPWSWSGCRMVMGKMILFPFYWKAGGGRAEDSTLYEAGCEAFACRQAGDKA